MLQITQLWWSQPLSRFVSNVSDFFIFEIVRMHVLLLYYNTSIGPFCARSCWVNVWKEFPIVLDEMQTYRLFNNSSKGWCACVNLVARKVYHFQTWDLHQFLVQGMIYPLSMTGALRMFSKLSVPHLHSPMWQLFMVMFWFHTVLIISTVLTMVGSGKGIHDLDLKYYDGTMI